MCELNHSHCHNFCPIDVAKGLCRLSGTLIMTDSPRCEHFSEKPRCGNCHHFCDQSTPAQCQGLGKIYWADANANASLCEAFARR
ncbi:4-hydroxyphenylacetate decarboxylase small subunit [unidentified bacterial endosymbiont]|jgi:4-hydroxyphenylacetate decarboxylase small subunit|uniref:4-hydroxyphenylacetate decarboxylase small subunit n=1 Tax=unidentified bacterial endosymbiont TaxID=2355 RepID=UPI00344EADDC